MPEINITKTNKPSNSIRARQVSGMFDSPTEKKQIKKWKINAPYDEKKWNIGLIVGSSGSGKSTILENHFGKEIDFTWTNDSVLDDFQEQLSINEITKACSAVGFNTIPSWLRPYHLLSNGEQFRIKLARALIEDNNNQPIIIDEFTSVVDRQVAKIGSHAVQKYIRNNDKQFIAASCHYDIVDWLQPDWIIDASRCIFEWRRLQQRPKIKIEIKSVDHSMWKIFAPYHYINNSLIKSAKCYVAFINENPVSFVGIVSQPNTNKDLWRISRWVTLPDWQGIGLAFVLADTIGSVYKSIGKELTTTPAHPALIRSCDKNPNWKLLAAPGFKYSSTTNTHPKYSRSEGSRPSASFKYCGPKYLDQQLAKNILLDAHGTKSRISYLLH